MSIKTVIQFFIILLIVTIIGAVYLNYFETKKNIVEEVSISEKKRDEHLEKLEKKIEELEKKNNEINNKINNNSFKSLEKIEPNLDKQVEILEVNNDKNEDKKEENKNDNKKNTKKEKIKNFVKDIEYTSVDQKGNKFYLLAKSGKSNIYNNDLLDLDDVRGEIKSDKRDTIYILSNYAQYNTINLNSKFYEDVKINYQNKEISCENFDINMETSKAIAYNNVVIRDPKSVMRAGIIEFDLKTKNININPDTTTTEIEVISN